MTNETQRAAKEYAAERLGWGAQDGTCCGCRQNEAALRAAFLAGNQHGVARVLKVAEELFDRAGGTVSASWFMREIKRRLGTE